MTTEVKAYGAIAADKPLEPLSIARRPLLADDINIEILYCGVCHSDIHNAENDWGGAQYPLVPGHEIIGRVLEVGSAVTKFKAGDHVGVGCLVDSCLSCPSCHHGDEQYCDANPTFTYDSPDAHLGGTTLGGYSQRIVVKEHFVLRIPDGLDLAKAGPLLCAGITVWSPLQHWNIQAGDKVGVIGLGGLGHMAIKIAHAMGAKVTMITRSADKGEDAKLLGADDVLLATDRDAMRAQRDSFDFLLNTIPVGHDVDPYLNLLKKDATMVLVGALEPLTKVNGVQLIRKRKNLAGSLIGGLQETQEMLDFCGKHKVLPEVEMINIQDINQAWERVKNADVKYRFVIDMASLA